MKQKENQGEEITQLDVIVVGAGPAGIGITAMLADLGVRNMIVLDKGEIGSSFKKWPKEMKLITPSFTTNFYGQLDLNSIAAGTSPAYSLKREHPSGLEYARYLNSVADFFGLPVIENVGVESVTFKDGMYRLRSFNGKVIECKNLIWAAGEYQYPMKKVFPGSYLCRHNSTVKSWAKLKGEKFFVLGGYESGIDAAINLSKVGKKVCVLDSKARWHERTTDPSLSLSPYTHERLLNEMPNGRIELIGDSWIDAVKKKGSKYEIFVAGDDKPYLSSTKPILATGFESSLSLIEDFFDWDEEEGYALINDEDESTKFPGLFLVGPQVRHENLIFCFIYKYRQRFGVVANAIGKKLGLDTDKLEKYRKEGLYLDDLSCCGDECDC